MGMPCSMNGEKRNLIQIDIILYVTLLNLLDVSEIYIASVYKTTHPMKRQPVSLSSDLRNLAFILLPLF
jgi:hypothetical protein